MDTRGNIKPLSEFSDEDKEKARLRLEAAVEEHKEKLEQLMTPEALERIEAKIDQQITGETP